MELISLATMVWLTTIIEFGVYIPPVYGIIGGQNAKNGMFPWTVALYKNGNFICTASIISEDALLTAAECVVSNGVPEIAGIYRAQAGDVNKNSPKVKYIDFESITVHPNFTYLPENNLAVMKTVQPISFGPNIQPIRIATPDIGNLDDKEVVVMGWGETSSLRKIPFLPETLQYSQVTVISNSMCSLYQGYRVSDSIICAGETLSGVCNGDSGGPLVYFKNGEPIEVGVASVNSSCSFIIPPTFARVSSYTEFIMESAGDSACQEK